MIPHLIGGDQLSRELVGRKEEIGPIFYFEGTTWRRPPIRACPGVEELAPSKPPSDFALAASPQAPGRGCHSHKHTHI